MNNLKKTTLVILLSTLYSFGFTQFTVNQNIISPTNFNGCYNTIVTDQDLQWRSNIIQVSVTHDVYSPTDPDLEKTINQEASRLLEFDIYHDTGSQLQFVKTIPFPLNWMVSDTGPTCTYGSVELAGTPEGNTVGLLRVKNIHSSNSSYALNLNINLNGSPLCSYTDFENTVVECAVSQTDCFYYHPCGEVQITPLTYLCPLIGGGFGICYEFTATVPNGSGNYTYDWNATEQSSSWSSSNSTFTFQSGLGGRPIVTLALVDQVTGCQFDFTTAGKRALAFEVQNKNLIAFGPNPAANGQEVTVDYVTASDGAVSISLYDLQGREVQRVHDATAETAGIHNLDFVPEVPSGVYLIGMKNANGFTTQKLLIQE